MKKIANTSLALASAWQIFLFVRLDRFIWDVGLVVAWFTSKGLVPYKDFDGGPYFPIPKFIMFFLLPLFNWSPKVTIYIGLAEAFAVLFLLYYASRKYLKGYWQAIPFIYFSIWHAYILGPITFDTNIFVGIFLLGSLLFFKSILEKNSQTKSFLLGLLSGLSFFSQQMSAIPIGIIFISTFIFLFKKIKGRTLFAKSFVLPYIFGALLPAVYLFGWFYQKSATKEFIDETILYYLDSSRYPFSKLGQSPFDIQTLLVISLPLIPLILSLNKKNKTESNWFIKTSFTVILATTISMLFAVLHPRRFLFTLPSLSFLLAYPASVINILKNKFLRFSYIAILIILVLFSIQNILPDLTAALSKVRVYDIYNEPHAGDGDNEAIEWIKKNTPSTTKIQVMGPMLYYYETQRLPASSRTYSGLPWTYEPLDRTINIWTQTPPDYWLVDEGLFRRYHEWGYDNTAKFIRNFLDKNYTKVASFKTSSVYKYNK